MKLVSSQTQRWIRSMSPALTEPICIFFICVCCLNEVLSATTRRKQVLPVACPHVLFPPNAPSNTYYPIQYMGRNNTRHNTTWQCCVCNPGEYLDRICSVEDKTTTVCTPCPPGTYITDVAHTRRTCTPENRTCPVGKVFIPSRPDKSSRCDCRKGSHLSQDKKKCIPHTPCKPGYGVKVNPSATRDTECEECLHGYGSPNESHVEKCERLIQTKEQKTTASHNIELTTINLQNVTDFATSATTSTETSFPQQVIVSQSLTIPLAVGILLAIVVVVVIILVYKRHKVTKLCNYMLFSLDMSKPQGASDEESALNESCGSIGTPMNDIRGRGRRNEGRVSLSPHSRNDEIKGNNSSVHQIMEMSNPAFLSAATSASAESHSSENNDKKTYKNKMKQLRKELSAELCTDVLHEFYRYFAEKFTDKNVDQMMEDLKNEKCDIRERSNIAFGRLMDLGEADFNPQLIYNYFEKNNQKKYSDIVKTYL